MDSGKIKVLDINEEFWDLPDQKVIWDGVPFVNESLYKILISILIGVIVVLIFLITVFFNYVLYNLTEVILILGVSFCMGYWMLFLFIHDYFRKKRKSKYVLLSEYLVIRDGDKITTKGFRFTDIERVIPKDDSGYVSIILRHAIANPFSFFNRITKEINIGPFENSKNVAEILDDHIRNTKISYPKRKNLNQIEFWKKEQSENEILWEGRPLLKDRIFNFFMFGTIALVFTEVVVLILILKNYVGYSSGFSIAALLLMFTPFLIVLFLLGFFWILGIRQKSYYKLEKEFIIVKAGHQLKNVRFKYSKLQDVHLVKSKKKVRLVLKENVWHPFNFFRNHTHLINIGPFKNPEEILEIIKKQITESTSKTES